MYAQFLLKRSDDAQPGSPAVSPVEAIEKIMRKAREDAQEVFDPALLRNVLSLLKSQ